ncbi:MAG: adenosylhomocysteinase [Armatimonadetes bacterium]|nr:adenosylhomocysteinase [Armatimonadota bacterium]
MKHDVKDLNLAPGGAQRLAWAENEMPVLRLIRERFEREKPLRGLKIAACLHVTSETANLMRTLAAGGAEVALCASNPLSTQDDVAAALIEHHKIPVFAVRGEDRDTYYQHIVDVLSMKPSITMDDGADLVTVLHNERRDLLEGVVAGTEETTTGVVRLRSMAKDGVLQYPIVAVNDAKTKHWFDNRYGTGQSAMDGLLRATNLLLAGRTLVVGGYGSCGRGVASRARGLGARVLVTEIDPMIALEAVMDGFEVMPMAKAAVLGDVFMVVTGNRDVLRGEHFEVMHDGAVLANAGHFNVEIDIPALEALSTSRRAIKDNVEEFRMATGRRIYLLAEGRLLNLAAAEGHPAAVMDMSFANQALSVEWVARNAPQLKRQVYGVPEEIDRGVAALKLRAMNVAIDDLTPQQAKYLASWEEGT